jgi:hypothetical protein
MRHLGGNRLSVLVHLEFDGKPTAPGGASRFEIHFKSLESSEAHACNIGGQSDARAVVSGMEQYSVRTCEVIRKLRIHVRLQDVIAKSPISR